MMPTNFLSSYFQPLNGRDTLFAACSNVTIDYETGSMITRDCVNGTWMETDFNGGYTNYSYMMKIYGEQREEPRYRAAEISYEQVRQLLTHKKKGFE